MKLINLLEDFRSDEVQRNLAAQCFEDIIQYLKKPEVHFSEKSNLVSVSPANIVLEGLYIYINTNPERSMPGLSLQILPSFFNEIENWAIVLNATKLPDKDKIINYLLHVKTDVLHELIHFLDIQQRHKSRKWKTTLAKDSLRKYFNNPLELNAYFQEATLEFEREILPRIERHSLNYFEQFYDEFLNAFEPMFLARITQRNQQRIRKRAYQYWLNKFKNRN